MTEIRCARCGGAVRKYGTVKRMVRGAGGEKEWISVQRWQCLSCKYVWRELPDDMERFKQYRKSVIEGVRSGEINCDILEYEDYPCEMTMRRWRDSGTQN